MRGVLLAAVLAAGCGKPERAATEPGPPDAAPAGPHKQLDDYRGELARTVPFQVADFENKNLKAEEYQRDEKYPQFFRTLVMPVERVYLVDRVTGKGRWYSRAKFTLNDPRPYNGKRMPEVWRWADVEMLP